MFYLLRGGKSFGPYSAEHLKKLARTGKIRPSDQIRREGIAQWTFAIKVKGLFPEISSGSDLTNSASPVAPPAPPKSDVRKPAPPQTHAEPEWQLERANDVALSSQPIAFADPDQPEPVTPYSSSDSRSHCWYCRASFGSGSQCPFCRMLN